MPVTSKQSIKPIFYIPPSYSAAVKLTVEDSTGYEEDITERIVAFEITDGATNSIGNFRFTMYDPNEDYTDLWNGMEIVRFYSDYATTATTLRFRGRIEKVSHQTATKIEVTGRSESVRVFNLLVTKQYTSTETSIILKDLISTYTTEFTVNNVATSSTTVTTNWNQKPFWECIKELCIASGFDCYIDCNLDFHYFLQGNIQNIYEGIVHDFNLYEIGDFAEDTSQVINRVSVYGARVGGVQVVYTADDLDSQSIYGYKEEVINDENITDYTQAGELAQSELADKKDAPMVGDVTSALLLATLQPASTIKISSPADGIIPGGYRIITYTHKYENGQFYTTVKINKEPAHITQVFNARIKIEKTKQDVSLNPYQMRYSYVWLFDADLGTHNTTQIINGVLKLQTGTNGTWTSPVVDSIIDVSEAYIYAIGQSLTGASFEVSANGGADWITISNKTRGVFSITGTQTVVRVTITDANTQIDSLNVQWK